MEIFSSETGEWSSSVASSPRMLTYFNYKTIDVGVVACKTMLHWVDVDKKDKMIKGFVGFDPFIDAQQCCYIDPPTDLLLDEFISLGVFQGRLRIYQRPWLPIKACDFYVWELEDYINAGTWCLKHKVYFKDMVSDYPGLVKIAKDFHPPVDLLAFHPNDGELVFLQFRNYVVLCNMRTGVLKFAGQLQDGENLAWKLQQLRDCTSKICIRASSTIVSNTIVSKTNYKTNSSTPIVPTVSKVFL